MSKEISESQIMSKVASMIGFIKNQTKMDIVNAKNEKMFNLDEKEVQKLCNIIETSIQSNFIKSSSEITSLFK